MASRVIGLDIGAYSVKAAVFETSFRTFELVEVLEEAVDDRNELLIDPAPPTPTPEPVEGEEPGEEAAQAPEPIEEDLSFLSAGTLAAIERLASRGVFDADQVILGLPKDRIYLTQLTLPFEGTREVDAILLPQLDGKLPVEVDELLLDHMSGGPQAEGGFRIHAAGIPQMQMAMLLGELESVGIDPRIVDVAPFTLFSAVNNLVDPIGGAYAVMDMGFVSTGVVIGHGDRVEWARVISSGAGSMEKALARAFEIDFERARAGLQREGFIDASAPDVAPENASDPQLVAQTCRRSVKPLVRQLRSTLLAHANAGGQPVEVIYLTGGAAAMPGLAEYIGSSIGVPCQVARWTHEGVTGLEGFNEIGHRFASSLGLGMRGSTALRGSGFNLRKGPFLYRGGSEFLKEHFGHLLLGAAAMVACLGLLFISKLVLLNAEARALDDALAQLTSETLGKELTSPSAIETELLLAQAPNSFMPSVSAYEVFGDAALAVDDVRMQGKEVVATAIEVDMGRQIFSIEGTADSANSVDTLLEALGTFDCFKNIERDSLEMQNSGSLRFAIGGAVDCTAPQPAAEEGESNGQDSEGN